MNVKYDDAEMECDKGGAGGKAIPGSYVPVAQLMSGLLPPHELKVVTSLLYVVEQNHQEIE